MSLLTFAEVLAENRTAATVGGKALHLAEMAASAATSTNFSFFAVPRGVVLTTDAYFSHIANAGVDQAAMLDGSLPLSCCAAGTDLDGSVLGASGGGMSCAIDGSGVVVMP